VCYCLLYKIHKQQIIDGSGFNYTFIINKIFVKLRKIYLNNGGLINSISEDFMNDKAISDFTNFENTIKYKNRYFVDKSIIESLKSIYKCTSSSLERGLILFRGRKHKDIDDKLSPLPKDKIINSDPMSAFCGRATPVGINYLYLASHPEVCIKELSPRIFDIITIAEFSLNKEIKIVNFADSFPNIDNYLETLTWKAKLLFNEPQISSLPELDYLPSQFICELAKLEGFDGVKYHSAKEPYCVNHRYNLVLFDLALANIIETNRKIYKVNSIEYDYDDLQISAQHL